MKVQKKPATESTARRVFMFGTSRTCWSDWQNAQGCVVVVLFFLLVGCSSEPTTFPFLNNTHRQAYSVNEDDLKKVQFYVSTDIVAQVKDPGATQSFLVPRLTPGVVTAAGPNWIKVSFRKGGADVPFVADPNQYDSRYYIASEVEGGKVRLPWSPEPMPCCSWTGTAGKRSSQHEKSPGVEWLTSSSLCHVFFA
jgi:hypothetical protein